ncbi:hypothetical protein GCM10010233_54210 [Streptomyces pseudogriseolus]|uniref:Uncharacterized protein n=1 Tax=Streptomyces pseudogriseolus TaxID=36817 RepID=A0ABQ2TAD1_STREZ|nr:hypothetical protein GCM10010233_54210 [Streptomyces gancidicus]GGS60751.1 hypothetical protein GCM10010285_45060 [Streptomyces rubiginosus]
MTNHVVGDTMYTLPSGETAATDTHSTTPHPPAHHDLPADTDRATAGERRAGNRVSGGRVASTMKDRSTGPVREALLITRDERRAVYGSAAVVCAAALLLTSTRWDATFRCTVAARSVRNPYADTAPLQNLRSPSAGYAIRGYLGAHGTEEE